jgi:hypothetical protein
VTDTSGVGVADAHIVVAENTGALLWKFLVLIDLNRTINLREMFMSKHNIVFSIDKDKVWHLYVI